MMKMSARLLIRNVSDTARWMAIYRAQETERDDAAFRDPYARALGRRAWRADCGAMRAANEHAWSFIARTYLSIASSRAS